MTPKRGELDYSEIFDSRGRIVVPKTLLYLLNQVGDIQDKLDSDYDAIKSLPCRQQPQQPCLTTTQALPLPQQASQEMFQIAQDAAIGAAIRRIWTTIPHVYRCIIIIVSSSSLGGGIVAAWPHIKAVLMSI